MNGSLFSLWYSGDATSLRMTWSASKPYLDGDLSAAALPGDAYLGVYTFDDLPVRGDASVVTVDEVDVLGAPTAEPGSSLDAHNLTLP